MKRLCTVGLVLLLAGCGITRKAEVSSVDVTSGIVRLDYGQPIFQTSHDDAYITSGTATRECQAMGYSTATAYGQPVETCSVISGSLCLNSTLTVQYQCQGYAPRPAVTTSAYH